MEHYKRWIQIMPAVGWSVELDSGIVPLAGWLLYEVVDEGEGPCFAVTGLLAGESPTLDPVSDSWGGVVRYVHKED